MSAGSAGGSSDVARLNALVVDDSAALRRDLVRALRRIDGMASSEAENGAEAWRKLAGGRYDVVLTDVNMPVLDGLKLVALVRGGGAHREVPIVVVTTEGAEADRRRALALGASAYLVKPVRADEVVETVRGLLAAP
jgi:two-component system chemotaxis response regulator CheY